MKVKKITALLLAGVISLSALVGCSSNENSQSASGENQNGNSQSQTVSNDDDNNNSQSQESFGDEIAFPLAETMDFTAFTVLNEIANPPAMLGRIE